MNFTLKPDAEADIAAHIDYLLGAFAYDAAERFPDAFGEATEFIRANPEAGAHFAAFRSWPLPSFRMFAFTTPSKATKSP